MHTHNAYTRPHPSTKRTHKELTHAHTTRTQHTTHTVSHINEHMKPQMVCDMMWAKVAHLSFDVVCGVPYTALPMVCAGTYSRHFIIQISHQATAMSLKYNKPMLIKRKEVFVLPLLNSLLLLLLRLLHESHAKGAKAYGTKQALEGVYHKGQRCLIIEDLVTSGISLPLIAACAADICRSFSCARTLHLRLCLFVCGIVCLAAVPYFSRYV
jgi:hypothetical protein